MTDVNHKISSTHRAIRPGFLKCCSKIENVSFTSVVKQLHIVHRLCFFDSIDNRLKNLLTDQITKQFESL